MIAITPVQYQPQPPLSVSDAVWQVMLGDPAFLALNIGAVLLVCIFVWIARTRYGRFYKLQREAVDHRKSTDARVLARQEDFEQLISRHYGAIDAHNQQVLAKAEEALRFTADTLAQITAMNRTLARIAERLEQAGGAAR